MQDDPKMGDDGYPPNSILARPLVHLFNAEPFCAKFRRVLTEKCGLKSNKGQFGKIMEETLDYFRELNPEALETTAGIVSKKK